jgi:ribosomal protein S18 acetylase RimI-like enzyme
MKLIFEKISRNVDRDRFNCGVSSLNEYLKRYALQSLRKNVGVTIIAASDEDRKRILGYYSVSMAQVEFDQMPEDLAKGLPRYPVPAMRLGRLAVDVSTRGMGIGAALLRDALLRAVGLSREVGTCVMLVDAIDDKAKAFYQRYGFIPLQEIPLTLVLPIETIASAFAAEE